MKAAKSGAYGGGGWRRSRREKQAQTRERGQQRISNIKCEKASNMMA